MILPDKYVDTAHSLLGQAALLLKLRRPDMTVSDLWGIAQSNLSYERFILALDFLFAIGIVELRRGTLWWSR
jgi:hypothetical protein